MAAVALTGLLLTVVVLAAMLLLVMLAPYVVGPIAVRGKQVARPRYDVLNMSADGAPGDLMEHLDATAAALRPHGFEPVETLSGNTVPRVRNVVLLLVNRQRKELAVAAGIFVETGGVVTRKTSTVQVVTRIGSDRRVTTGNGLTPGVFAPVAGRVSTRLPGLADLEKLLRVHRALVEETGGASAAVLPDLSDPARFLTQTAVTELEDQVAAGTYEVAEGDAYRPTWKGACLMTWKLLPPWRGLSESRVKARAERLLAEHAPARGDTPRDAPR